MLQRLQSKAMIRKMSSSVDAVESITSVPDKEVVDLHAYVQSLPSKLAQYYFSPTLTELDMMTFYSAIYHQQMQDFDISGAIGSVLTCLAKVTILCLHSFLVRSDALVSQVNALIALKEPWKMDNPSKLASVLSVSIEGLRKSAILLSPIIPSASKDLLTGLGYTQEPSWLDVQDDHTIIGMRKVLDTISSHGPRNPVFPRLEAVEAFQS